MPELAPPTLTMPSPGPSGVHRSLVLEPDPAAVRQARNLVRQVCQDAGVDADTCSRAALLASETVTNAFIHGRSEARVQVHADPDVVLVQVADDNSRHPIMVTRDAHAVDGRGMEIVGLVANRWGIQDDPYGKTLWFEVRAAAARPNEGAAPQRSAVTAPGQGAQPRWLSLHRGRARFAETAGGASSTTEAALHLPAPVLTAQTAAPASRS